jgi:hypothetical protein
MKKNETIKPSAEPIPPAPKAKDMEDQVTEDLTRNYIEGAHDEEVENETPDEPPAPAEGP